MYCMNDGLTFQPGQGQFASHSIFAESGLGSADAVPVVASNKTYCMGLTYGGNP